jgi:hypothetical protein
MSCQDAGAGRLTAAAPASPIVPRVMRAGLLEQHGTNEADASIVVGSTTLMPAQCLIASLSC